VHDQGRKLAAMCIEQVRVADQRARGTDGTDEDGGVSLDSVNILLLGIKTKGLSLYCV
jgi:hypothetical protein